MGLWLTRAPENQRRHPRAGGGPCRKNWIPAFAGMIYVARFSGKRGHPARRVRCIAARKSGKMPKLQGLFRAVAQKA